MLLLLLPLLINLITMPGQPGIDVGQATRRAVAKFCCILSGGAKKAQPPSASSEILLALQQSRLILSSIIKQTLRGHSTQSQKQAEA